MIFSIPSGNAIDKLKWFIYLTNEFGAPSEDNIELFIENFGKIILNGNFKKYILDENKVVIKAVEKHLTELWSEITSDKNVATVQSGGINFYTKLSTTKFTSEQEIIDFIMSYETMEEVSETEEKPLNILQIVRKYSDIPLTVNPITAYITKELIIDIYPREQKIVVNSSTIEELAGEEFSSLEEVTMQYILSTLSLELKDIDEEIKQLYIECLHSWKRLSDDFSIEYLYE